MNVNFAERAHNHNWKLDPIVRSLLDTDFYKLLMLQFIWKNFPQVSVTSEVLNRTVKMRLADRVGAAALVEQMEHVRQLRFRKSELVWLAGNTFYGTRSIFEPAFLDWLEHEFKLSGLRGVGGGRPVGPALQRALGRGDDVGGLRACDRE